MTLFLSIDDISKQISYLVSLNTPVLESIKISWELIVYFSMKNQKFSPQGDPLDIFQIFSRVSLLNFSVYVCLIVSNR